MNNQILNVFSLSNATPQISTLSEVFLSWHEIVVAAEARLTVLEREQARAAVPDIS